MPRRSFSNRRARTPRACAVPHETTRTASNPEPIPIAPRQTNSTGNQTSEPQRTHARTHSLTYSRNTNHALTHLALSRNGRRHKAIAIETPVPRVNTHGIARPSFGEANADVTAAISPNARRTRRTHHPHENDKITLSNERRRARISTVRQTPVRRRHSQRHKKLVSFRETPLYFAILRTP